MHHQRPLPLTGKDQGPNPWHQWREVLAFWEMLTMALRWREPGKIRDGQGQHVLLIPGYGASERSLRPLQSWLTRHGYIAHQWGNGRNDGDAPALQHVVAARLQDLYSTVNDKISLVGWSLGGYLAREAARDYPDMVRQVISMGTPVIGGPKYTRVANEYREKGIDLDAWETEIAERFDRPITVPTSILYCPKDGVVSPAACIDHWTPNTTHIRVNAPHLGMGFSPDVMNLVARLLLLNDQTPS